LSSDPPAVQRATAATCAAHRLFVLADAGTLKRQNVEIFCEVMLSAPTVNPEKKIEPSDS